MINRVDAAGVSYENIILDVPAADLANYVNGAVPAGIVSGTDKQADKSAFDWTWAAKNNAFSAL